MLSYIDISFNIFLLNSGKRKCARHKNIYVRYEKSISCCNDACFDWMKAPFCPEVKPQPGNDCFDRCLCGSTAHYSTRSKTNRMCLETSRNLALSGDALWLAEGDGLRSRDLDSLGILGHKQCSVWEARPQQRHERLRKRLWEDWEQPGTDRTGSAGSGFSWTFRRAGGDDGEAGGEMHRWTLSALAVFLSQAKAHGKLAVRGR